MRNRGIGGQGRIHPVVGLLAGPRRDLANMVGEMCVYPRGSTTRHLHTIDDA